MPHILEPDSEERSLFPLYFQCGMCGGLVSVVFYAFGNRLNTPSSVFTAPEAWFAAITGAIFGMFGMYVYLKSAVPSGCILHLIAVTALILLRSLAPDTVDLYVSSAILGLYLGIITVEQWLKTGGEASNGPSKAELPTLPTTEFEQQSVPQHVPIVGCVAALLTSVVLFVLIVSCCILALVAFPVISQSSIGLVITVLAGFVFAIFTAKTSFTHTLSWYRRNSRN